MKTTQEKIVEGAFIEFVWLLGSALQLEERSTRSEAKKLDPRASWWLTKLINEA